MSISVLALALIENQYNTWVYTRADITNVTGWSASMGGASDTIHATFENNTARTWLIKDLGNASSTYHAGGSAIHIYQYAQTTANQATPGLWN